MIRYKIINLIDKPQWHCDSISAVDSLTLALDFIKLHNILNTIIKYSAIINNIVADQKRETELSLKFADTYIELINRKILHG